MLLQNRDARFDALVTDIHGRAGDKTFDLIRHPGTERASQRCVR
jgi:hypothetical protein